MTLGEQNIRTLTAGTTTILAQQELLPFNFGPDVRDLIMNFHASSSKLPSQQLIDEFL